MSLPILEDIRRQNEIIISLLGRIVFDEEEVRKIIIKYKREDLKENYIDGYNACDGRTTITDIAENVVGVSIPTMSKILQDWAEIGIIYEVYIGKRKFYKRLYQI